MRYALIFYYSRFSLALIVNKQACSLVSPTKETLLAKIYRSH